MDRQPNWMLIKFAELIEYHLPHIRYIAWDLDGTLGEQPGWTGQGDILDYIIDYPLLRETMRYLTRKFEIRHVLVSRNGMFCKENYAKMKPRMLELGFHGVLSCYSEKRHSKVVEFYKQAADNSVIRPNNVLLIDDQEQECKRAQADGAYSLHINTFIQEAILNTELYTIYQPQK